MQTGPTEGYGCSGWPAWHTCLVREQDAYTGRIYNAPSAHLPYMHTYCMPACLHPRLNPAPSNTHS